jgi:hypothetical protein
VDYTQKPKLFMQIWPAEKTLEKIIMNNVKTKGQDDLAEFGADDVDDEEEEEEEEEECS